jgi:hypothetical protein
MTSTTAGTAGRITGRAVVAATRAARTARHIAAQVDWVEVATIVAHGLIACAWLTWAAGFRLGRFVHALNDHLARFVVACTVPAEQPPAPAPAAAPQHVAPTDPAPVRPAMAVAVELVRHQQISQRQAARRAGVSRTALQRALAVA